MVAVHSTRWHRVSGLRPRLSSNVRPRRQLLRGETWYLLADPASGRSVRLNAAAYGIAARLDGQRTVQQVWDQALQRATESATQDEVIDLLAQLREAALVQFDRGADFDALLPHLARIARPRGRGNLLAWRLPLANPSALLDRLRPLQGWLFSRGGLLLWLVGVATLLVQAAQHAPQLWAHGERWMATPRFALLALLLYVPIKLVHELAHGLAVRRWGGQVREAGVTLMLLMPVPYVNASAASSFPERRHRVAVSAAGIMAELGMAALALPLWLWLDDGLARDAAFVTLAICGVSTLVFNANPLQRLDGYYILGDLLQLPNLGPRSRGWWLDVLRRRVLRAPGAEALPVARGETFWLAVYAPLSWLMAIAISLLAVAWIGQLSLALGLAVGLLLAWQVAARPALNLARQLRRAALAQGATTRRWRRLSLASAALALLVLLLPWPRYTLVQGVVWPPDDAQLRIEEAGFVDAVLAQDGQMLQAGDLVLQLVSPQLQSLHTQQAARVAALEAELLSAQPADTALRADARAGDARAELAAAQSELGRLGERLAALGIHALATGRLALPYATDLPGQFLRRGRLLGQVITPARTAVRVALPEADAGLLRDAPGAISVRLRGSPDVAHSARLLRDSAGAVLQLPSAALSTRHGGRIVTDPGDPDSLKPLAPVVLLDLQLDAAAGGAHGRVGERAWVRFDAGYAPLVLQWVQALRRHVLQRFNAQF